MNIIKIRDFPVSPFAWYQSQKGKPNFFGYRVSFRSLYSPSGTLRCSLRHRISSTSPPPPSDLLAFGDFFQPAILRPETSDSEAHEADLHVGGNPVGKELFTRRHMPLFSDDLPSMRRRVWTHGPLSGDEIPSLGSFDAVLLIHPFGGPPRALIIHLFDHFGSAAFRQSLFSTVWVTFLHLNRIYFFQVKNFYFDTKTDLRQPLEGCLNARWVKKGFYNLGFREKE